MQVNKMTQKYEVWQVYKLDTEIQKMIYQIKYFYKDRLFAQMEMYSVEYALTLLNEFRKSFTKGIVDFPQKTNPALKPINPSELEALVTAYETNQSIVRIVSEP